MLEGATGMQSVPNSIDELTKSASCMTPPCQGQRREQGFSKPSRQLKLHTLFSSSSVANIPRGFSLKIWSFMAFHSEASITQTSPQERPKLLVSTSQVHSICFAFLTVEHEHEFGASH